MSIKKGVIEVSPLPGLFFPTVAQDDLVIRTTDQLQSILIGTLSNQVPAITLKGSNIGVNNAVPLSALDIHGDVHSDRNILVNGKIGINTLSPSVGLEVKTTDAVLLPKGDTAQRPVLPEQGHVRYNTTTSQFEGYGGGNAWGSLGGVKDTNNDTYVSAETFPTSNDDHIRFINSNQETMRITKTGYVGIGFSNPQARLHVDGDIKSSGTITACNLRVLGDYVIMNTITSNTEQMSIRNDGTGPSLMVTQTGTADVAAFYDDNDIALLIADGAKVGIRSSNPQVVLEINGTDAVLLPKGSSAQRPAQPTMGHVRYNTTTNLFEGFGAGNAWGSLGGVKDTNQDTYISAEQFPTSNDDVLRFINSNQETMRITKDGDIGIGVTTPQAKLHVEGDFLASGTITTSNLRVLGDYVVMNTTTSNTEQMTITNDGTGPALRVTQVGVQDIAAFYDDSNIAMMIADGAKVGIRTNTPQVAFEVHANDAMLIPKGTTGERPNVPVQGHVRYNTNTNQFEGFGAGNAWGSLGGVKDTNQDTYISAEQYPTSNDDVLRFINSNQETMRITADGNVGIGASNPAERLRIVGDAYVTNGMTISNDLRVSGTTTTAGDIIPNASGIRDIGASAFRFQHAYLEQIDLGGAKLKTTPSTLTGLTVLNENDTLTDITIKNIHLSNYGDTYLYTSNNNLGIQTTSPTHTLHVAGDAFIRDNLTTTGDILITHPSATLYTSQTQNSVVVTFQTTGQGNATTLRDEFGTFHISTYNSNTDTTFQTTFTSNGQVGIGTDAPTERLEVVGHTKITSNLYVQGQLGVNTSNPVYTMDVRGTLFAQTYCNLLLDTYDSTSTSNAPTALALKETHDALVALSNYIPTHPSMVFTSNTAVYASNVAIWTSNSALIRANGGAIEADLQVYGTLTASNIQAAGHVVPSSNVAFDIGSESNRFRDLYLSGNKIDLNGLQIRKSAGGVTLVNPNDGTTSGIVASQVTLSNRGEISIFTSNNRVGFNTSNPISTVDIEGELHADHINTGILDTTGLFVLKNSNINHRTTLAAAIQNIEVTSLGINLFVPNHTSNDALRVYTSNAQREPLTVNALGYVGLSTSYPKTRLVISPSNYETKIALFETASESNTYHIGIASNQFNFHVPDSNAAFVFQYSGSNGSGTDVMRVDGNSTMTLYSRNSNQAINLDFVRGENNIGGDKAADFRIQASDAGHLIFQRHASNEYFQGEVMRMNHLGFVGVNNASPLANVDISGTLSTNRSFFRKDFTFVGASNSWTGKKYLGEIAVGTTTNIWLCGYGHSSYTPYACTVQKRWGNTGPPKISWLSSYDDAPTFRVRFYWYQGSTSANDYYHLWFDYYDINIADNIYVTLDVHGYDPNGGLAWKPTAEPSVAHATLDPPHVMIDSYNGFMGIRTSNPTCPLFVQGAAGFSLYGYNIPRTTVSSLNPNLWAVAGESTTRVGSYTPSFGGTILHEVIQGKSAWKVAAQDSYIEFPFTINATTTTFTIALAIASPPISMNNGAILFNQIVSDADSTQHTNHSIRINNDFRTLGIDEHTPGGTYQATILPPAGFSPASVITVRRNTTSSLSIWYNGVKIDDTASFSVLYNGTAPTTIRLGARSLNASGYSPIGLAYAAMAVWDTALSDTGIRTLTYDALTAL